MRLRGRLEWRCHVILNLTGNLFHCRWRKCSQRLDVQTWYYFRQRPAKLRFLRGKSGLGSRVAADDQNGPGLREFAGEAVPTRSTRIGSDSKKKVILSCYKIAQSTSRKWRRLIIEIRAPCEFLLIINLSNLKFKISGKQTANKPVLFMQCLIHGNEWITGSLCMYLADKVTCC